MMNFNFTWDLGVSLEQMVGLEMAAAVWAHYFSDDITINLHIASTDTLGEDGQAVGGAVPLFHEVHYGVFKEYYENDISGANDTQAHNSFEHGNNLNLIINGELVDGNTQMLITSAQAKALGMDQPLQLDNGTTWDQNLVDPNALDGYIIINQSFDWNYDFTRSSDPSDNSLDFFSMALHEIGHQLGFVSGIDGTMEVLELHSGETRIEDFTLLDLFRKTIDSNTVSDVTLGENAYFSIDGGTTNLAEFSTGDQEQDFQASHWKRFQTAIGIMDPTLAYKERLSLTELDLQAFDVLGYNINLDNAGDTLNLHPLMKEAEARVSLQLEINLGDLTQANGGNELYRIGYSGWWKLFEKQIHEIGYSGWWEIFELGKQYWEQELTGTLEIGYSGWWQLFDEKMRELESQMLAIGYSGWWQEFQEDMLAIGYSGWWEVFEIGYSGWWQELDSYFSTLEETNGDDVNVVGEILRTLEPDDTTQTTTTGGDEDDIIGGLSGKDLINGLKGDDLMDGKSGTDILMGDEGDDMIYGLDGDDTIYGGVGDDFISGEIDNDELYGEEGADIISGGAGDDFLSGGQGRDVLKGDQGQDVLMGGTEDDILEGGDDNDLLLGEQGKDLLDGGAGDDILRGDGYSTGNNEPEINSLQAEIGISAPTPSSDGVDFWVRLEAESMRLINYTEKADANASGGAVVSTAGNGKVRNTFTGPTGTYDLVIAYYDDASGQGQITLKVGEQEIDSWVLNQDSNGLVTRTIQGVELRNGERIELRGQANGNELVRIDYVDVIAVAEGSTYDYNSINPENRLNLAIAENGINTDPIRLEAEAATTLSNGYQVESGNMAYSGDAVIATAIDGEQATATYSFTGSSGVYNIFVSYLDALGGEAKAKIKINEQTIKSWQFDQDSGLTEYRLAGLNVALNQGDIIEIIAEADGNDGAKIDYLELIPVSIQQLDADADFTADYILQGTGTAGRVEVENMTLTGPKFKIESENFASGVGRVKTDNETIGTTATTTFNGTTGFYNIVVGYYDEDWGLAEFTATLNNIQSLDSWQANLKLGYGAEAFVSRTIATNILLNPGDELQLQAISEGSDKAYLDYIDFVPYDPTAPIRVEAEYMNASGSYTLEEYAFASSGRVLRSEKSDDLANALKLDTAFTGESGQYNIVVHYFDENDGMAQLSASLGTSSGTIQLDSWLSNQDLGNKDPAQQIATSRTVATNMQLNTGDVLNFSSIRNDGDYGRIDYVEFIPYSPAAILEANAIQLEIEDMQLTGEKVKVKEGNFAYGGGYVETDDEQIGFTASNLFMGEDGYYDIVLGYYDSNKGEASLTVKLNEDELNSWLLNQDFGTDKPGVDSFTTRNVAQAVYLEKEDVIQIIGLENSGDKVNADYIKFIPVEAPVTPPEIQEISQSDNGDVLRGGGGNDQLFGDEGDDLLYGEDEYDTPYSQTAGNDTISGGSGDDVLYGNSGNDELYGDEIPVTETDTTVTETVATNPLANLPDGIVHNGSLYLLTQAKTWTNAQAEAQSLGGNLVSINDAIENQWLLDNFGTQSDTLWIGLTLDENQQHEWVNGEAVTYTNWGSGNHDDLYWTNEKVVLDQYGDGWNEIKSYNMVQGIAEINVFDVLQEVLNQTSSNSTLADFNNGVIYNGSLYLLSDTANWENAQAQAESLGGNLVTINDAAEEQWIKDTFGSVENFWIGFTDKAVEGEWKWVSGQEVTYTNWLDGQGYNDAQDYAMMNSMDQWNDRGISTTIRGIIEIDLTSSSTTSVSTTEGNDTLTGNSGNDNLFGGAGDDILNGTDQVSLGKEEQDFLTGGAGADTFILGDADNPYYVDSVSPYPVESFVTVTDFDSNIDRLQLHGNDTSNLYSKMASGDDLLLSYQGNLVAVLQNNASLESSNLSDFATFS